MADSSEQISEVVKAQTAPSNGDWAERRLGQIRSALLGEELAEIEARLAQVQASIAATMQTLEARAEALSGQIADVELQLQAAVDKATPREGLAAMLRSVADKLENGNG